MNKMHILNCTVEKHTKLINDEIQWTNHFDYLCSICNCKVECTIELYNTGLSLAKLYSEKSILAIEEILSRKMARKNSSHMKHNGSFPIRDLPTL